MCSPVFTKWILKLLCVFLYTAIIFNYHFYKGVFFVLFLQYTFLAWWWLITRTNAVVKFFHLLATPFFKLLKSQSHLIKITLFKITSSDGSFMNDLFILSVTWQRLGSSSNHVCLLTNYLWLHYHIYIYIYVVNITFNWRSNERTDLNKD